MTYGKYEHKKAHESFFLTVAGNIINYHNGKLFPLSIFTKYLKEWILSHTPTVHKNHFEYYKRIAALSADERSMFRQQLSWPARQHYPQEVS
jgi:hemerythrin